MLYNRYINNKQLNNFQFRIGYQYYFIFKKPIIIDMTVTPHIFVSGLSGQGKTKMIEYAIQDKNVILLNTFKSDFKTLKTVRRINGNDNILRFFDVLFSNLELRNEDSEPLYLVLDELLVLCMDKNIVKSIIDILAIGRHYNIFLIGISQNGTKESVKFKDLFNTRICFRQVEESSYRAVLGYSPTDIKLHNREFYLYSDQICKGYTYTV